MEPIRLIAMDLDGTLLKSKRISSANLAALKKAHASGVSLVFSSGRLPDDISYFAADAGLQVQVVGLNGGCMLDRPFGQVLWDHRLNADEAERIVRILSGTPLLFAVFSWDELAVCRIHPHEEMVDIWGTHLRRPRARYALRFGLDACLRLARRGAGKIVVIAHETPECLPPLRARIAAECPGIEISASGPRNLELNPRGVSKGAALSQLCARSGIPLSQAMALGDGDNDASMLSCAGFGVAMGNASRDAMLASHYRTLSYDQDGLAAAINTLLFDQKNPGVAKLR